MQVMTLPPEPLESIQSHKQMHSATDTLTARRARLIHGQQLNPHKYLFLLKVSSGKAEAVRGYRCHVNPAHLITKRESGLVAFI